MTIVIAGERSGVGKTTVTLALLASLHRWGSVVQSFKVGPDYIDPMFHKHVTDRACRNLDPVLTSEAYVRQCFTRHIQSVEYAVIEGVMGLFDGAAGHDDEASTAHVARILDLPVVLVLDCSRLSRSVAAIAHGYRTFDSRVKIAGVVLNRVGSDRHLEMLKSALESLELPILGILRRQDNITIPDRHLGLVPAAEIAQMDSLLDRLADLGNTCFDWDNLLLLLQAASQAASPHSWVSDKYEVMIDQLKDSTTQHSLNKLTSENLKLKTPLRIAVARDCAFSFYYQDNLDCLQELGAELISWSPLSDPGLPERVQGMYFGGGFPEVFAQQLAENQLSRRTVRAAIQAGMPTYAECGGLMYLCQQIEDFNGKLWKMVGALPTTAVMGQRLILGYRQAVSLPDSPLLPAGGMAVGHEFHRSLLTSPNPTPLFQVWNYGQQRQGAPLTEGWRVHQVHASYIHLSWGERLDIPARFLQHCASFNPDLNENLRTLIRYADTYQLRSL